MKTKITPKVSGIALAIAAAGLVGCSTSGSSSSSAAASTTDLVHCSGVNKCGGHNDCGTANNACAGKASCKGTGFVTMPSKACADIGGKRTDAYSTTVSTADLIHCYGVNVCNGHNDCKTSQNACAGQASCKGTGFVSVGAKACKAVGGSEGA